LARSSERPSSVERPELDPGGAYPILHLPEIRHAVGVQRHDLTVEDDVVVGQIGGQ
jgi:hypothetical protein